MKAEEFAQVLGGIREEYLAEAEGFRRGRKPGWGRWAALAACLGLLAAGAWLAPGGIATGPGGTSGAEVSVSGNGSAAPGNRLVVNEAESILGLDMDVRIRSYGGLSEAERAAVMEEFAEATGLDYETLLGRIPAAFAGEDFLSVDAPAGAGTYAPHDYVFTFRTEDGGTARVAVCAGGEPLRDCLLLCEDPEISQVGGEDVVICGDGGRYMAQFTHEGVGYDVEAKAVSLAELEELLEGLMG